MSLYYAQRYRNLCDPQVRRTQKGTNRNVSGADNQVHGSLSVVGNPAPHAKTGQVTREDAEQEASQDERGSLEQFHGREV